MLQSPQVLSSKEEITKLVDFAEKTDTKILFIQVYRANQSWFSSKIADPSPYEKCQKTTHADPFGLLINESHKKGVKVYAWLNLLSLSKNANAPILQKYGVDILTKNLEKKNSLEDYKIDNQYFLEPSDDRVRRDLSGIVEEIVTQYPALDGILFDYIRYPDVHPSYGYATANITRFKKATGVDVVNEKNQLWRKWKRDQVTELLQGLVKKARSINAKIGLASSGCVSYVRAYEESFQDWPLWANTNIVDFVILMNYPIDVAEFSKYTEEARTKVSDFSKVQIAVGAYKLLKMPDIFSQQFSVAQKAKSGGLVIFHYGSLLESPELKDTFLELLKNSPPR
jgi:uncharacterized lipoprotein YddW (UPF0748 family)